MIHSVILFYLFQFFQFLVPVRFQRTDNEPVFRVGKHELLFRPVGFILRAFDCKKPLPVGHFVRVTNAVHDFEGYLQLGGLHNRKDFF